MTDPASPLEMYHEDTGEGAPVVLVHAATLDHTMWRHQVPALARDHRVIACDLRGHGRTDNPGARPYAVDVLAEDLHGLIEVLGLDRPVVCGISLGGMVALTLASRYPRSLGALVLAGTVTPAVFSFSERLQRAVMPRAFAGQARLVGYERMKRFLIRVQRRVHGDEAAGRFSVADMSPMTTPDFARVVRCFATFHQVEADLAAIDVPTLVLVGGNEPAFVRRHGDHLARQVRGACMQIIEGAGHASNLDAPDLVTAKVRAFIADLVRITRSWAPPVGSP